VEVPELAEFEVISGINLKLTWRRWQQKEAMEIVSRIWDFKSSFNFDLYFN